jgi:response regulator of citrate/malate metabolism
MRVLIVEDVEEMLELLVELVRPIRGVDAISRANNAIEARQELERHRPDVVLLDEVLPMESATDLAKEMTQRGIPVIFVTSTLASKSTLPPGVLSRLLKPDWDDLSIRRPELEAILTNVTPATTVVDPVRKKR